MSDPAVSTHLRDGIANALAEDRERILAFLSHTLAKATDDPADPDSDPLAGYDWTPLGHALQASAVTGSLSATFSLGQSQASLQVGVRFPIRPGDAITYARARAAEMVGMRLLPDGRLIPNPDARWRITDATRAGVQAAVVQALDGTAQEPIRHTLETTPALYAAFSTNPSFNALFGEYRAEMIARSELAIAANAGTAKTYQDAGVDEVDILDNPLCPICGPVAGTRQTLQWFKDNPIGHPHCVRAANAVVKALKKDGTTAGITVGTGLTGYELEGQETHDDDPDENRLDRSRPDDDRERPERTPVGRPI